MKKLLKDASLASLGLVIYMYSILNYKFIVPKYGKTRANRADFHQKCYFRISADFRPARGKNNGENEGVSNGENDRNKNND